jgi:hypothetical protein
LDDVHGYFCGVKCLSSELVEARKEDAVVDLQRVALGDRADGFGLDWLFLGEGRGVLYGQRWRGGEGCVLGADGRVLLSGGWLFMGVGWRGNFLFDGIICFHDLIKMGYLHPNLI